MPVRGRALVPELYVMLFHRILIKGSHCSLVPSMNSSSTTVARRATIAVLSLLVLCGAQSAFAATRFWTGASATSGNWTTGANWQGGVAPSPGDILQFVESGARKTSNTNNFAAGTTFSVINCFGNGAYRLRGNRVTITNSVNVGNPAGNHIIDLDITFGGPETSISFEVFDAGASLTVNGDINLTTRTLIPEGPGDITIAGTIAGTGGVFKNNPGGLLFEGLGANTFTGTTTVGRGVLRLNRYNLSGGLTLVGTTAIAGNLVIGDFASTVIGDIAVLDRDNQIADTSVVSVFTTGSLELSGDDDTIGTLNLRGGTVTTGAGILSVDGGIYASVPNVVSKESTIAGRLNLGVRGDAAQIVDVASGAQLNIAAQISGVSTADLIKTNRGDLFLSQSNIFSGDVQIKGGTITISDGHALGTTNGVTRFLGGTLHLDPPSSFGIPESLEAADPGNPTPDSHLRLLKGNASWLGNLRLEQHLYFGVQTNATLTVVGQISGPDGWSKRGPGTLQFKTPYTNSYEGYSAVFEGNFIMDGVFHQPVISGYWFSVFGSQGSTRAWMIKNNQIADTTHVELHTGGVLDLAGFNDTVGRLTVRGGSTIETGDGILTLDDSLSSIRSFFETEPARIHGHLSLGGATRSISAFTEGDVNNLSLLITAEISDGGASAGFSKGWNGPLQLTGANTFTGPVSVTDGTLILSHSSALGSSDAGTTVSGTNGAKIFLQPSGGNLVTMEPLTLNSTGPGSPVVLENFSGLNQWNGPITLLAPENTVSVLSIPRTLSLGGAISGPGGLRKVGPGQLILNGLPANTFVGPTTVADGDLILDKPTSESINAATLVIGDNVGLPNTDRVIVRGLGDEINNGTRVLINGSGQLILDGFLDMVGSIEGSGNVHFSNASSGLIVGRNDLSTTFDGVISGAGGFEKVGAGTLILNGTHTYTGASGATEGTLVVNGSIASSLLVQLNRPLVSITNTPFGVLAGNGSVPAIFPYAGGTVSPGSSPGRLTVAGHTDLTGSDLRLEINGTTPIAQYDQLRADGNVTLSNTRLFFTVGFLPTTNDTFLILEKTSPGPINGFFLNTTEGSIVVADSNTYHITYQGGDGNDVVLRRVEIPGSKITGIAPDGGEKMVITGQGLPFVSYILEATPTLTAPIPWIPVLTNSADVSGIYQFAEPYAEAGLNLYPQRYFRVISP